MEFRPQSSRDVLDKNKGTTNVVARSEEEKKLVFGSDSRLTLAGLIRSDTKQKYDLITPTIVGTMVGNSKGCEDIWERMQEYCKLEHVPKTIGTISEYGSGILREDTNYNSSECFVMGIESDKPTIYRVVDVYKEEENKRRQKFKEVVGDFAALGTGSKAARLVWDEFKRKKGRDPRPEEIADLVWFALLEASLIDPDTGGILRVIQVCSTGIQKEPDMNVLGLYIRFYDQYRILERTSFFLFYIPSIKKSDLRQWLREFGEVSGYGHPMTKLCGRYYMHRVVFKVDVASDHLGAASVIRSNLEFTTTPTAFRFTMIKGKKVFIARQSENLLRSLKPSADPDP